MSLRPEPDILWHYTDANGMFGILGSRQFRFGDAGFLNDCTERVYGKEVVDRVFVEEIAAGDEDGLLSDLRKHVQVSRSSDRIFVCSFSATKECISQWQRYGVDGTGYCLGFDAKGLDALFDKDMINRVPMLYEEAEQKEYLRKKIRRGVDTYRRKVAIAAPEDRNRGINLYDAIFTAGDVDDAGLRLKNPFFADEQEWRYFERVDEDRLGDDDSDEEFAVRGAYVKPFMRFPRMPKRGTLTQLPVVDIVCGPRLDVDIAKPTVERLLQFYGHVNVNVERSALTSIWR